MFGFKIACFSFHFAMNGRVYPLCGKLVLIAVTSLALTACDDSLPSSSTENDVEKSFVGSQECIACHTEIYEDFIETGMGKSISPLSAPSIIAETDNIKPIYDEGSNLFYEPVLINQKLGMTEFRLNGNGDRIFERTEMADLAIGSGNATRSYLQYDNGLITEMPLTWYVDRQIWDMSPGYSQNNFRFDRPIDLNCLSCHSGPVERTDFTSHHFSKSPEAISCEKCHGQASQHVENKLLGLGEQDSNDIVNPADLDRERQLAVCQQCHLTGVMVYKEGESHSTFQPGQLVSDTRAVFASADQIENPERFGISSHAERLQKSDCFVNSPMTCTTCHDPHKSVENLGTSWEIFGKLH